MNKRNIRNWSRRQYQPEELTVPWPLWVRWLIGAAVIVFVAGKLAGVW